LAVVIARTVIFPIGVLEEATYLSRLLIIVLSLIIFFISKRNYVYPTIFSALGMALLNNLF
jgi:hypothetical protein